MLVTFEPNKLVPLAVLVVVAPNKGAVVELVVAVRVLPVDETPKLKVEFDAGIEKAALLGSLVKDVLNRDCVG